MSQNNDPDRPNPSQTWYDTGQVPQSKKFPFGAGNGDEHTDSETRHNPQVDQYGQGTGGNQNFAPPQQQDGQTPEQTPPYGQQPVDNRRQAPQYGNAPQQNQGQYPPQGGQPQSGQPQNGGYGPQGSNGPGDQQQYNNQGQGPRHMNSQSQQTGNEAPVSGDSGNQQFQGILDPHTGEIHPVPDLEGLQDTDALLVVVSGPDSGSQILLDTDVVTVGRSPNADIFLDDVTVSRKHAEFIRTPSGFTLRDTGSLNGTYVGRQLIDSIELQNGADLQIGKFRMIFQQRPRS